MTKFENENAEWNMVECEAERIYAQQTQGEQSTMVQHDMKAWAIKVGMWPSAEYKDIVEAHAKARGWTQPGFTGMEVR
jgi:hypothetical protein